VERLLERRRGVRRLDVLVLRPRSGPETLTVELSRASVSGKHLWTLVRSRLERVDLSEPVDGLRATATRTAPLRDRQMVEGRLNSAERTRSISAAVGELTDTLISRLGPDRVVRFAVRASHVPERTAVEQSAIQTPKKSGVETAPGERPTVLLDSPEPVSVMALTPDGPVLEIGRGGVRERVTACIGPERIGPEWWRWRGTLDAPDRGPRAGPPADRDYFAVQVASGQWLWVCRQVGTSPPRWFVHGEWG
jgi:protein ImuB